MEIRVFYYLIEWAIGVTFFYFIYFFLLKNETFFKLNRMYLIVSLLVSAIIPVLHFQYIEIEQNTDYSVMLETINVGGKISNLAKENASYSIVKLLFKFYLFVVILLIIRFLYNILSIFRFIVQFGIEKINNRKIAFVDSQFSSFSFFDILFINKEIKNDKKLEEILLHEIVHANQLHTLDILLIEIVTIIQWFNPFVWFYRKALKETHEYLADRGVLEQGFDSGKYQMLLLQQQIGVQPSLANNFNKSLILKRLVMLNRKKSNRIARIKFLVALPLVWFMLFAFSFDKSNVVAQVVVNEKLNSTPIYIVDGVEKQSIDDIDPNQIESMNVYKGEEAIKKYGDKGKNGVIFILLKKNTDEIIKTSETSDDGGEVGKTFLIVEEMPEFPGGDAALRAFIAENVKYPESLGLTNVEGRVYVRFVVNKLGKVEQVKVARGVHEILDNEAVRVVSMLPDWKPGRQGGKEVDTYYTVPIMFSIQ